MLCLIGTFARDVHDSETIGLCTCWRLGSALHAFADAAPGQDYSSRECMLIITSQWLSSKLATHLSVNMWAVSSNASWALGQLVEQVGPDVMSPYAGFIAQQLCRIVVQDFGNISLRQNACITLVGFLHLNAMNLHTFAQISARPPLYLFTYRHLSPEQGRFADACPTQLAEYLPEVLGSWCRIMAKFQAEGEKIKSFKGQLSRRVMMTQLLFNTSTICDE